MKLLQLRQYKIYGKNLRSEFTEEAYSTWTMWNNGLKASLSNLCHKFLYTCYILRLSLYKKKKAELLYLNELVVMAQQAAVSLSL